MTATHKSKPTAASLESLFVSDRDLFKELLRESLRGSEIDFVDDLIGASFKIQNPNATASCGCGTSFSL